MRWLEVRRHSLTRKDSARDRGSHLSADGVALARLVGESLGPFASVVTSASPRAIETAVAMGFAVDDTVAEAHRRIWTSVVAAVPDGAAALVVGHGGGIEPGLVACLPDADYQSWGGPFGHCDGARLSFNEGGFVSVQFRRAPEQKERGNTKPLVRDWVTEGTRTPDLRDHNSTRPVPAGSSRSH